MNRNLMLLAGVLAVAAASASAQDATRKKLYRWVDAEGKVHIADTLPPEEVDKARREINAESGSSMGTIDRELTPEEQALYAAEQQRNQAQAEIDEKRRRDEDAMLESYPSEEDLKRAYGDRISLLKQTLESTDVSLLSLRTGLAAQLAEASEAELAGRPVDAKRLATIRDLHVELIKQRVFQANRHTELLSLDAEFERMLERYRGRKAELAAAAAAAEHPSPPPPPPQP
jgi:hypothetical protein